MEDPRRGYVIGAPWEDATCDYFICDPSPAPAVLAIRADCGTGLLLKHRSGEPVYARRAEFALFGVSDISFNGLVSLPFKKCSFEIIKKYVGLHFILTGDRALATGAASKIYAKWQ